MRDDRTEIRALLDGLAEGHRARDAAAIGRAYAPGASVADLAPPLLRRGFDAAATQAWLDGWAGPVELTEHDTEIAVSGDLAVAHGLLLTRAPTGDGEAAWWCRSTFAFARTPAGWRIAHAHSSVPFHMDGSERAALDLQP